MTERECMTRLQSSNVLRVKENPRRSQGREYGSKEANLDQRRRDWRAAGETAALQAIRISPHEAPRSELPSMPVKQKVVQLSQVQR